MPNSLLLHINIVKNVYKINLEKLPGTKIIMLINISKFCKHFEEKYKHFKIKDYQHTRYYVVIRNT